MKNKLLIASTPLLFVLIGCGLLDKFKQQPANNSPSPTPSATYTTTPPQTDQSPSQTTGAFHDQKNLLAFGSGTIFAKKPAEYYSDSAGNWTAMGLIDETAAKGWAKRITDGGAGDVMVLEMSEQAVLKNLVFDTKETENNSSAKNFTVEVSNTSATDGFTQIAAGELKDHVDGQVFKAASETPARWVRLSVKDNYGSTDYTEIMEFRGYGDQLTKTPLQNVSGTYKMEQYGPMHIKQDGTSVIGCYEYNNGIIEGGVEDRVMRLKWTEGKAPETHGGPALMVFSSDGKKLTGAWGQDPTTELTGIWNGQKISNDIGTCPQLPQFGKSNAAQETIGNDLKEKGRASVYGINFDFNSDVIREESKPTLTQIVAILKENGDWKMLIEGHTDNVGGESYNQSLSEKRAASVKNFLIAAGIDAGRLSSAGLGMSKPVASNDNEFGRAKNRRVELVKQ